MIQLLGPLWLDLLLYVLATYRVTRLFTFDHLPVVAVPRIWITNQLDPSPEWRALHAGRRPFADRLVTADAWLTKRRTAIMRALAYPIRLTAFTGRTIAYLLECDWCLSVWIGAGGLWLWTTQPKIALWVFMVAAASGVTGLLAGRDGRHNP